MLHLIWGLVNISLFFYFLYLLIVGGKLVRQKLGLFAAVVFTLGLLSFAGGHQDANVIPGTNQTKQWKFSTADSLEKNSGGINWVNIDSTLINKCSLTYQYGFAKGSKVNVPVSASSVTTGITSGTEWIPQHISITPTNNNNQFRYAVYGVVEWHLLGFTVFTQSKTYAGTAPVRNHF